MYQIVDFGMARYIRAFFAPSAGSSALTEVGLAASFAASTKWEVMLLSNRPAVADPLTDNVSLTE